MGAYGDLAVCLEIELRAKVDAIRTANQSDLGVGATDQYTTISTVDAAVEVLKLKWEIRGLEAERDYLEFAIEHHL
jgi:hypothetical protein